MTAFECRIFPSGVVAFRRVRALFPDHEMALGASDESGEVYGVTDEELETANELLAVEGIRLVRLMEGE